MEGVARQSDDAEEPWQTLPRALFRPVECGALGVSIDKRDPISAACPFTGQVQG